MESLYKESCEKFTELLASPAAVPGGGGASALVGAIGIALGDMVGELTVGKKKYADVEEEIKALMVKAQDLRVKLLACIDHDAEAFEPLSKAYGIPKDDPTRDEVLEKCLHEAEEYGQIKLSPVLRSAEIEEVFQYLKHCPHLRLWKPYEPSTSFRIPSDFQGAHHVCRSQPQLRPL